MSCFSNIIPALQAKHSYQLKVQPEKQREDMAHFFKCAQNHKTNHLTYKQAAANLFCTVSFSVQTACPSFTWLTRLPLHSQGVQSIRMNLPTRARLKINVASNTFAFPVTTSEPWIKDHCQTQRGSCIYTVYVANNCQTVREVYQLYCFMLRVWKFRSVGLIIMWHSMKEEKSCCIGYVCLPNTQLR